MKRSTLALGAAGLALFAAGLIVARLRLPEWRVREIPPKSYFAARFQQAAQRGGISTSIAPRFALKSRSVIDEDAELDRRDPAYRTLHTRAPDWLTAHGRGPFVEVTSAARWPAAGDKGNFRMIFSLQGEPLAVRWMPENPLSSQRSAAAVQRAFAMIFTTAGAAPRLQEIDVLGYKVSILPLAVADVPETLVVANIPGSTLGFAHRLVGSAPEIRARLENLDLRDILLRNISILAVQGILALGCVALFIVLLYRRRIDLTNGTILAVAVLLFAAVDLLQYLGNWYQLADDGGHALFSAAVIFVLWSASESWIRSTTPSFRTTLDTLRVGRIGPRSGNALLCGWAGGAAVAGIWLLALTAVTFMSGVSPTDGSIHLPMIDANHSPLHESVLQAGFVLFAIGASLQVPGLRRIPFCSTILAALFVATRVPISSFGLAFVAALLSGAVLVMVYARFGLAALLSAGVTSVTLPAAVYAALHLSWLGGSFLTTVALSLAPLAIGLIGLSRPSDIEEREVSVPTFVRRLEEERRVQHEMDLLARMQLGLLPQTTPSIAGYEIAARSILATEAGGDLYDFVTDERNQLWIAAGDVSGHGYSCAIAQAMTKAGLASLIEPQRTPAAVLTRLDRVLRTSDSARTFTSLALLRLDPARGEGLLANAGHPYPLVVSDREVREISLSSLPLGHGPARAYEDRLIRIAPGDVVVFCSDGLFESLSPGGNLYGFERVREVLRDTRTLGAGEILDRILDDWKKHIGRSAPADDTTVVVLKRMSAATPAL